LPSQAHEREPAVVGEIGAMRPARRIELRGGRYGRSERDGGR